MIRTTKMMIVKDLIISIHPLGPDDDDDDDVEGVEGVDFNNDIK